MENGYGTLAIIVGATNTHLVVHHILKDGEPHPDAVVAVAAAIFVAIVVTGAEGAILEDNGSNSNTVVVAADTTDIADAAAVADANLSVSENSPHPDGVVAAGTIVGTIGAEVDTLETNSALNFNAVVATVAAVAEVD